MYNWGTDLYSERCRSERNANREYKTDLGLWRNQHSGSQEIGYVKESSLYDAIAEYERSNQWD